MHATLKTSFKIILKVRVKNNNKKSKLRLNLQRKELEVKAPLNKALKPLIVNLLGLDTCLMESNFNNRMDEIESNFNL